MVLVYNCYKWCKVLCCISTNSFPATVVDSDDEEVDVMRIMLGTGAACSTYSVDLNGD
jgi:hypothetical protein